MILNASDIKSLDEKNAAIDDENDKKENQKLEKNVLTTTWPRSLDKLAISISTKINVKTTVTRIQEARTRPKTILGKTTSIKICEAKKQIQTSINKLIYIFKLFMNVNIPTAFS